MMSYDIELCFGVLLNKELCFRVPRTLIEEEHDDIEHRSTC